MDLTSKQMQLIELGKAKNGLLHISDFQRIYSSPVARKEAINRLIILRIIKPSTKPDFFEVI